MDIKFLKWLKELIRLDNINKFYKCKEWRALRLKALDRDKNECQQCKERGYFGHAECVHHIKEVKDYPELALELYNLKCLCNKCHNITHPEKQLRMNKKAKIVFSNEERW